MEGAAHTGRSVLPPSVRTPARRAGAALGLLLVAASALIGSGLLGVRNDLFGSTTAPAVVAASSRDASASGGGASAQKTVLRSQPWWQRLGTFRGSGSARTAPVAMGSEALALRVSATCTTGRLAVRGPGAGPALLDVACPARATRKVVREPAGALRVTATGPWQLQVAQQIAVPLISPPLPAMTAPGARRVETGSLYRISQVGVGRVDLYRLADGRWALRLQNFYVTPNVDLQVRLSKLPAPRTHASVPQRAVGLRGPARRHHRLAELPSPRAASTRPATAPS